MFLVGELQYILVVLLVLRILWQFQRLIDVLVGRHQSIDSFVLDLTNRVCLMLTTAIHVVLELLL